MSKKEEFSLKEILLRIETDQKVRHEELVARHNKHEEDTKQMFQDLNKRVLTLEDDKSKILTSGQFIRWTLAGLCAISGITYSVLKYRVDGYIKETTEQVATQVFDTKIEAFLKDNNIIVQYEKPKAGK